jgi:hypothetical protein
MPAASGSMNRLPKLGVLSFGLFQDGHIWVGVFPKIEKFLVGGAGLGPEVFGCGICTALGAGSCLCPTEGRLLCQAKGGRYRKTSFQGVGATEVEVSEGASRTIQDDSGMIENLLKFARRFAAFASG